MMRNTECASEVNPGPDPLRLKRGRKRKVKQANRAHVEVNKEEKAATDEDNPVAGVRAGCSGLVAHMSRTEIAEELEKPNTHDEDEDQED